MSDVFISYAHSTATEAQAVAKALRALGYGVWLDDALPAHLVFADVIEERLQAAKAVVVIWSAEAVDSQWVRSEANRAREDGKLVQVTIDNERLPMPFEQIHCADLSGWSGDPDTPAWRTVLSSLTTLMSGGAKPEGKAARPDGGASGEGTKLPVPVRPSIAVLPFKNMSGDPEQEYLADAITEDIVTALSRWRWFFVIARHSSFRYKDRDIDVARVGDELGVRYALEGSVRKAGNRVRVAAQLVDTATGSNIWADQFNRDLTDVLALQDEITEQLVAAIEPAMLQGENARVARKSLTDFSGLDCFYRAMWQLNKLTEEGDAEALTLFREAIRRDPELSLGHIGLARVLYGQAIFGLSADPNQTLREARTAAKTAIGLDPRDAYGYFAHAGASLYLGDHLTALDNAQRAIALNPNLAYGHYRLGQVLIFGGRPAEAITPIERSLRFSPYDPQLGLMRETLALANYQSGNYDAAVDHARAAIHATGAPGSVVLAASLARLGRPEEAAEAYERARALFRPSTQRPLAAPYADPAHRENLREGLRLAGASRPV